MNIISQDIEDILWDKLYNEYSFSPKMIDKKIEWIKLPGESKVYRKYTPWTEEQENIINSFLEDLVDGEMYALDLEHVCFIFSPKEHIPFEYGYYDPDSKCNVCFPTYYPNGDYHLFFDKEWKYGIFGHPWKNEIVVMGKKLIEKFNKRKFDLNII